MKRTTVFLDDKLERQLKQKARREGKSFAQCVREAVAAYLAPPSTLAPRPLPAFVGMFAAGEPHNDSERVDEIIAEVMRKRWPRS